MRRHAKASSAGSIEGNGKSRGLIRRALAIRGASGDSKGSGAPKAKLALVLGGALALVLVLGVTLASAVVPTLTIEAAKEVSYTSALAKGTVDPQGKETNCHFEYLSQAQLDENIGNGFGEFEFAGGADCNGNPHEGSGAQNVEAQLTGLSPSTVYHLRLVASNEDGQSEAVAASTFETKAVAKPTVTLDPVTTFTGTTAHFTGSINPNAPGGNPDAFKVSWHFQCNPGCPGLLNGTVAPTNTAQPVQADATGLEPNTLYEVTLVAENTGGSESAGPVSFTTEATGPSATTIPAFTLAGGKSALVGGRVNPHKSATTYWIEWGTSDCSANLCQETPHSAVGDDEAQELSVVAKDGTFNVSFEGQTTADLPFDVSAEGLRSALEGLSTIGVGNVSVDLSTGEAALHRYRITFSGDLGGIDVPELSAASGTPPLTNGADPAGAAVNTLEEGGGFANLDVYATRRLTDLTPGATYHYRLIAENAKGESKGEDMTFKTPTPASGDDSCPNAQFRTGPSAQLPDCRAYELASESDLGGASARVASGGSVPFSPVAANGNAVVWTTDAVRPGVDASGRLQEYVSRRGPDGWTSRLISPPGSKALAAIAPSKLEGADSNLDRFLWWTVGVDLDPAHPVDPLNPEQFRALYREEPNGSFVRISQGSQSPSGGEDIVVSGFSADLLKVLFRDSSQLEPGGTGLYLRSGNTTQIASRDENNAPVGVSGSFGSRGEVLSEDGSTVAFGDPFGQHVWIRDLDAGHSTLVATDASVLSRGVFISALSSDGTRLILNTAVPLTPDDEDPINPAGASNEGVDLYEYNADTGALTRLSAPTGALAGLGPGNGGAGIEEVTVSKDGSTVYFVSTEQLDGAKGTSGEPNLYVHKAGATHFVATLDSGDPVFGFVQSGPNSGAISRHVRFTPDDSKLLFESQARLTSYDNDGHFEIYEHDPATGALLCTSCRPDGISPSGEASLRDPFSSAPLDLVNADKTGRRVFFQSNDSILPQDTNGKYDIYEFDVASGTTSLISTGKSPTNSTYLGNSVDGRDVFFFNTDSLTPDDHSIGSYKVYDARIGGGFANPPKPPVCEGEACRSTTSVKPPDAPPATPNFIGPGNPKPKHAKKHKAKKHAKHKSHKKQQSKGHKRAANTNGRTGR